MKVKPAYACTIFISLAICVLISVMITSHCKSIESTHKSNEVIFTTSFANGKTYSIERGKSDESCEVFYLKYD